jgi:hypothetical protein
MRGHAFRLHHRTHNYPFPPWNSVNLFETEFTPWTVWATRSAWAIWSLVRTVPLSVTAPPRARTKTPDTSNPWALAKARRTARASARSVCAGLFAVAAPDDISPPGVTSLDWAYDENATPIQAIVNKAFIPFAFISTSTRSGLVKRRQQMPTRSNLFFSRQKRKSRACLASKRRYRMQFLGAVSSSRYHLNTADTQIGTDWNQSESFQTPSIHT